MSDAAGSPSQVDAPRRRAAWSWGHVAVFLLCWGPLNPLVLNVARWAVMETPGPEWDGPMTAEFAGLVGGSVTGPFAAAIEGRNRSFCLAFGWRLFPWCAAALLVAAMVQTLWRPVSWPARVVRFSIWTAAWFLWFAAAFLSILNNSG